MTRWPPKRGTRRRRISNRLWGGSRFVTNRTIEFVGRNVPVTSRKRWELFGNRGSDHYRGNFTADAVDFGTAENHALKSALARHLGWDGQGMFEDYGVFVTHDHKGRRFRVQLIAGTHGTGPHLHVGVRRI